MFKIIFSKITFNLLAKTFAITLYKTLQRAIGHKSRIDSRLSHFGINVIKVSFRLARNKEQNFGFCFVEKSPKYQLSAAPKKILSIDSRLAKKSEKSLKYRKFSIFR